MILESRRRASVADSTAVITVLRTQGLCNVAVVEKQRPLHDCTC